jgi:hypothetical protein
MAQHDQDSAELEQAAWERAQGRRPQTITLQLAGLPYQEQKWCFKEALGQFANRDNDAVSILDYFENALDMVKEGEHR